MLVSEEIKVNKIRTNSQPMIHL